MAKSKTTQFELRKNDDRNRPLNAMARYFFDFKSDAVLSVDEEGVELLSSEAAHNAAVVAH